MPLTPQGFPVTLTFDLDAETIWTGARPETADMPITISSGRYGPKVGLGRILGLLERHGIEATFFVPGLTVERHPAAIEAILEGGHELAHHAHTHARLYEMSAAQEREEMERGTAAIVAAMGRPAAGFRAPGGEFSGQTMDLLYEQGFSYSSNFGDDDSPYLHERDGAPSNLVELPWYWSQDDAPYFMFGRLLFNRAMHAPAAVLETWKTDFDVLYAEDRTFMLVMHPQIIGRPARMRMLEDLVQYIAAKPGIWFTRCDTLADALRPVLKDGATG